jgi:primosomal protein N' (replication factor Y)
VGTVIVQTRNPGHYAIAAAAEHNYDKFYKTELAGRARYAYPPYVYLLKLWYGHNNSGLAESNSKNLAEQLKTNKMIVVLGPVPAVQKRQNGKFVWQIIIKAKTRAQLIELATHLPPRWQFELDPITLI